MNIKKGNIFKWFKASTIRGKLILSSMIVLVMTIILMGAVSLETSTSGTTAAVKMTLTEMVEGTAIRVNNKLETYRTLANEVAENSIIKSAFKKAEGQEEANKSTDSLKNEVDRIVKTHDIIGALVVDKNGKDLLTGVDISDRQYFKDTKEQKKGLTSDIVVSKLDGALNMMSTAPINVDGQLEGIIVLISDASILSDIAANVDIGTTGRAEIVDSEGTTIGYTDKQRVLDKVNVFEQNKSDESLDEIVKITKEKIAGKTGFDRYKYDGKERLIAYTPIPDTNGWSIDISLTVKEVMGETIKGIWIIIALSILCLAMSMIVVTKMSKKIVEPISTCVDRIKLLAQGDLSTPVEKINTNDETEVLADATYDLVNNLSNIINDIDGVLLAMAEGDLTSKTEAEYVGEFNNIKESVGKITNSLNETMSEITIASQQVEAGANQVSMGAQSLAQGSAEQAGSIEELSATVSDISQKVSTNSEQANKANEIISESGEYIKASNEQMNEMMIAMRDINEKSHEISKIIKTIDDIAFQTNILALNAAVEAARAGDAGKGFAVVADEVRELAVKSAEAAKSTTTLIEDTVVSVEKGSEIARETAKSLDEVVSKSSVTIDIAKNISNDLTEQATAIHQITQAIEAVSMVVQTNSATSEESAAASEELTAQSQFMNELVSKFKIEEKGGEINLSNELNF